jgi:glycosyltransferase involved in cell wall biosynthesis
MERYIERTLLSALGQSYSDIDIIVIDDGSTDATPTILESLARQHSSVRLVRTPNRGVAAARNYGTELAGSLYVAYLDGDDVWHPQKIELQMAALASHGHSPEWGACYSLYRMIDSEDRVLDNGAPSQARGDFFDMHLLSNPVGNGSNLIVRRDLALAVGGFNRDYAKAGIGGCEDLEFQLKLLRRTKLEVVREYLIGYRIHPAQMSRDVVMMRLGHIGVIEKICAECEVSDASRQKALVQSYLAAAKGSLLVRDWRAAGHWVGSSVSMSVAETVKQLSGLLRYEIEYWWRRLGMGGSPAGELAPARPFTAFAPHEGVDERQPFRLPYRSALLGAAPPRQH